MLCPHVYGAERVGRQRAVLWVLQRNVRRAVADLRRFACQIRIACDDLHDDPYGVTARATMLELLKEGVPAGPALRARQR